MAVREAFPTVEELQSAQLLDPDIYPLFEYHDQGQSKKSIDESQSTYKREAPFTTLDNGVLYYRALIGSDTNMAHAAIIPKALVPRVMRAVHDSADVGHPGEKITNAIVRERAYWRGMTKDIKKYIKDCDTCKEPRRWCGYMPGSKCLTSTIRPGKG
jgi:hypothetical protein